MRPELGLGTLFSDISYYPTALDLLLGSKTEASTQSLYASFTLDLTFGLPGGFAALHAGGGADLILETGGAIPLPFFHAGLALKPFALAAKIPRRAPRPPPEPPAPESPALVEASPALVEEGPAPVEASPALAEASPVPAEASPAPEIRFLGAVFFEPDGAVPREPSPPPLAAAAEALAADPRARLIIRGYSAPFGSPGGQEAVSASRARFCGGYLQSVHGVAPERMLLEWHGAAGAPETGETDTPWDFRRSAELFLETLSTTDTGEDTKEGLR
jgi:outer membrane protein OmpA-like peptidoglycan-associated protein